MKTHTRQGFPALDVAGVRYSRRFGLGVCLTSRQGLNTRWSGWSRGDARLVATLRFGGCLLGPAYRSIADSRHVPKRATARDS